MGGDKKHRCRLWPALPSRLCPLPVSAPGVLGALPLRPQHSKVPCRGTTLVVFAYRSDNHAAVLRLQNTQPKDRRAYNAPERNPCRAAARTGDKGREEAGPRRRASGTRTAALTFFICTRYVIFGCKKIINSGIIPRSMIFLILPFEILAVIFRHECFNTSF